MQVRYPRHRTKHPLSLVLGLIALMIWTALPIYPATRIRRLIRAAPASETHSARQPSASFVSPGPPQDSPQTSRPGANGRIVFASSVGNNNYEVFTANPDGSGRTQLTTNAAFDVDPIWSPDGRRIAFVSDRDGNLEIYVMNADGGNQTRLTSNLSDDFDPAWSPIGDKIAFSSTRDGDHEVYVMNADGSNQTNLTNNRADDAFPAWSPDGSRLIFTSDRSGNADIFIMNANGSGQMNISNNAANDEFPSWSPAGDKIVFSSDRNGNFDIFVMNVNGSAQTRLTTSDKEESYPTFSPNARRITYMVGDLNGGLLDNNDVFVMNADGSAQTNITNNAADEITPDWQTLLSAEAPFANPVDEPTFFVRQLYLDVLNREPDAPGLAYWVGEITRCGTDVQCVNRRRVGVAAAFFIEQEFQQTPYFIYRLYKATLERRLTFAEFMADRSRVMEGPNREATKQALVEDFVNRQEFQRKYSVNGNAPTGAQFIEALIQAVRRTSGVDLSDRRTEFQNDFNANASQARIVRLVIDDPRFVQAEYNRGFVLGEYFSFLRRDPDEAGYQFWVDVISNREVNNYLGMVCAFITSAEYQLRSGPVVTRTNADCASITPPR